MIDGNVHEVTSPQPSRSMPQKVSGGRRTRSGFDPDPVVEILADFLPSGMPVSVLYPRNRQLSPRVRVFIDWLSRIFGQYA